MNNLQKMIIKFNEERNWRQFHNPKDLALSLVLEATEVLEHFQWKNGKVLDNYIKENKLEIAEELADTYYWILLMANDLDIDLNKTLKNKMKENAKKYPVEKAYGKSDKYNKL
jgi:NTP pyrophosphatase (non-canonical NTP hydrolase)